MKSLDIFLSVITIVCVLIILLLVQAVSHPEIFKYLTVLNIFANGNIGIKNAIITIFSLGFVSSILLLFLFSRIIIRNFTKK